MVLDITITSESESLKYSLTPCLWD